MKKSMKHYQRRTMTPQKRHERAVSNRHRSYKHKTIIETPVIEEVVQVIEQPVVEPEPIKEEKKKITLPEIQLPEIKLPERKEKADQLSFSQRRALRKQRKDEELERLIDLPQASLLRSIIDPVGAVQAMLKRDEATLNFVVRDILIFLKWVAIIANPMYILYSIINAEAFGFSRINFTETTNYVFLYALYAFLAEIVMHHVLELGCSTLKTYYNRAKVVSVLSYTIPSQLVLLACSWFVYGKNPLAGIGLFTASVIFSVFMKMYVYAKSTDFTRRLVICMFVCIVLASMGGIYFVSLTSGKIVRILMNIMNI